MDEPTWEKHDPRYLTLERQGGALASLFVTGILGTAVAVAVRFSKLPERFDTPLIVLAAVLSLLHIWWNQYRPRRLYAHASFRVDDDGIEIRRGIMFRSIISVPRSRVQHTDVSQGPLERRHGLGTLLIYTAGVSHTVVPLPGIEHERAIVIRDLLLPRDRVVRT
ncbi:MAG TPA: PH domain-containing protein [Gemmatimonas sp.]|nr:PH domain-containing protein [Gemmatimonas sp.]